MARTSAPSADAARATFSAFPPATLVTPVGRVMSPTLSSSTS